MFFTKVVVFCFVILTQYKSAQSDCSVSMFSLTDLVPTDYSGKNILYPDGNGNIVTTNGKTITIGCPGSKIVPKTNNNVNYIIEYSEFLCTKTGYKSLNKELQSYKINQLTCDKLQPVEKKEPKEGFCDKNINSFRVVIGFQFKDQTFIPHIEVCWNNQKKTPLYALATIKYIPNGMRVQSDRPFFRSGQFFEKALEQYYTKNSLIDRGHLVPKVDFPLDAQQKLTFQYINAAPQWGSFNQQNWELVERQIRGFVVTGKNDLSVYTGTYGICQVNNKNYYLHTTKQQIPVPKYFWKVIMKKTASNPDKALGVAILGLNDIYATKVTNPCPDVIKQLTWLNLPTANNVRSGYVIACEIKNFLRIPELKGVLPVMPAVTGLLK